MSAGCQRAIHGKNLESLCYILLYVSTALDMYARSSDVDKTLSSSKTLFIVPRHLSKRLHKELFDDKICKQIRDVARRPSRVSRGITVAVDDVFLYRTRRFDLHVSLYNRQRSPPPACPVTLILKS